ADGDAGADVLDDRGDAGTDAPDCSCAHGDASTDALAALDDGADRGGIAHTRTSNDTNTPCAGNDKNDLAAASGEGDPAAVSGKSDSLPHPRAANGKRGRGRGGKRGQGGGNGKRGQGGRGGPGSGNSGGNGKRGPGGRGRQDGGQDRSGHDGGGSGSSDDRESDGVEANGRPNGGALRRIPAGRSGSSGKQRDEVGSGGGPVWGDGVGSGGGSGGGGAAFGPGGTGPGRGGRGRRRHEKWSARKRFIVWCSTAMAGVIVLGASSFTLVWNHLNGNIKTEWANLKPSSMNGKQDVLFIGSDSRAGANQALGGGTVAGARSDTTMVFDSPADRRKGTEVSIPRD